MKMDIEKSITLSSKINNYTLDLNCASGLYDFYAYSDGGSVEASFSGLTKAELEYIIAFLQEGTKV
jgi:hypothetical protein